jgi:hypothetical protein
LVRRKAFVEDADRTAFTVAATVISDGSFHNSAKPGDVSERAPGACFADASDLSINQNCVIRHASTHPRKQVKNLSRSCLAHKQ